MRTQVTVAPATPATSTAALVHRIWPAAVIVLGLVLNTAWVAVLGYALVSILSIAF